MLGAAARVLGAGTTTWTGWSGACSWAALGLRSRLPPLPAHVGSLSQLAPPLRVCVCVCCVCVCVCVCVCAACVCVCVCVCVLCAVCVCVCVCV